MSQNNPIKFQENMRLTHNQHLQLCKIQKHRGGRVGKSVGGFWKKIQHFFRQDILYIKEF